MESEHKEPTPRIIFYRAFESSDFSNIFLRENILFYA